MTSKHANGAPSGLAGHDFRLFAASFALHSLGQAVLGVALVVFAFQRTNSAAWAGAASAAGFLPYVLFSGLAGVAGDRYDRRLVMLASVAVRTVILAAIAVAVAQHAAVAPVLALAFVASTAATPFYPALVATTPHLVATQELISANSVLSGTETTAYIVAPAVAGLLVAVTSAAVTFGLSAGAFGLAAVALVFVHLRHDHGAQDGSEQRLLRRVTDGLKGAASTAGSLKLIGIILVVETLYGASLVLLILVATQGLHLGSKGYGFLNAAAGIGAVVAAGLANRLIRSGAPSRVLGAALVLAGGPFALLAAAHLTPLAYVLMVVAGMGSMGVDIVARTLLQRSIRQDVMARVFGFLDSAVSLAILLGSVLTPVLVAAVGRDVALVVIGAGVPVAGLALLPGLGAFEMRAAARARELEPIVERLAGLPVFHNASLMQLEGVAGSLAREQVPAGTTVITEGEEPDDFYVILRGAFDVYSTDGGEHEYRKINEMRDGQSFGEIGLLEKVPRTATVVATSDADLYRVRGRDFLEAVNPTYRIPVVWKWHGASAIPASADHDAEPEASGPDHSASPR